MLVPVQVRPAVPKSFEVDTQLAYILNIWYNEVSLLERSVIRAFLLANVCLQSRDNCFG